MPVSTRLVSIMAVCILASLVLGCSGKQKMSEFIHSKDHHSPATAKRFELAQQMEAAGNLDMAKQLYALVLADYPDDPIAAERLRSVLIACGEWNMHRPLTPPRSGAIAVASDSRVSASPRTFDVTPRKSVNGQAAIQLVADEPTEPLSEVDAAIRDFAQSESAIEGRAFNSMYRRSPDPAPAELTGIIEFAD